MLYWVLLVCDIDRSAGAGNVNWPIEFTFSGLTKAVRTGSEHNSCLLPPPSPFCLSPALNRPFSIPSPFPPCAGITVNSSGFLPLGEGYRGFQPLLCLYCTVSSASFKENNVAPRIIMATIYLLAELGKIRAKSNFFYIARWMAGSCRWQSSLADNSGNISVESYSLTV